MAKDWSYGEVLKAFFPLLDGKDLTSCMLVCRHWRDVARDDYLWKCICTKRWPSICLSPPPTLSYHKLFLAFSRPRLPQPPLAPRLSFEDLEFYIDLWSDQDLIFSKAVTGSALRYGIRDPPTGVPDSLRAHLSSPDCKMAIPVEPMLIVPLGQTVTVSVLVSRRDTGEVACVLNRPVFDYIDGNAFRAYSYLSLSPGHPFVPWIRAWVSLLFMAHGNDSIDDIFGIVIDFCDAASSEVEVLWLLDMLDWK